MVIFENGPDFNPIIEILNYEFKKYHTEVWDVFEFTVFVDNPYEYEFIV